MHIENFRAYSVFKKKYTTFHREPFFAIVADYCRSLGKTAPVIADIGSGQGDLFIYLRDNKMPVENLFLLDSNPATVEGNKAGLTGNSLQYAAPDRLPFADQTVDLVHTSHMIEYLSPKEMYHLMLEMNRVLAPGGYLVISAPLIWDNFFNDLGHVRPYNPMVFQKYFIEMVRNNRLAKVADSYQVKDLVYRYHQRPLDEGWSSVIPAIDSLLITLRRLAGKLGFKKLYRNGYTLVLLKSK